MYLTLYVSMYLSKGRNHGFTDPSHISGQAMRTTGIYVSIYLCIYVSIYLFMYVSGINIYSN
jgi:hypothetical protein